VNVEREKRSCRWAWCIPTRRANPTPPFRCASSFGLQVGARSVPDLPRARSSLSTTCAMEETVRVRMASSEVSLRNGEVIHKGLKTSLYELRKLGRAQWRKQCSRPAYFVVSRETGKLSYHWRHAFGVAASGPDRGAVINPDTGTTIANPDGGTISRQDLRRSARSSTTTHARRRHRRLLRDVAGGPRQDPAHGTA